MRIECRLCHLSEKKAVVKVNGWINDKNLGSSLAEASTVELAEDKAISRLYKRLNINNNEEGCINSNNQNEINTPSKIELPKSEMIEKINVNQQPSDWSDVLTSIDSEIARLNWSRDEEISYLQKKLGYNHRNKITKYEEIVNYLNLLKKIDKKDLNNKNINTLIEESDHILRDLSWNHKQGREYLEREFNVSTRKDLDENQLIDFVEKLKFLRNHYTTSKTFQDDK